MKTRNPDLRTAIFSGHKFDFFIQNSSAVREYYGSIMSTDIMATSEGNVTWLFSALFKSSCPIRVRYYPFDDQVLKVILHLFFIKFRNAIWGLPHGVTMWMKSIWIWSQIKEICPAIWITVNLISLKWRLSVWWFFEKFFFNFWNINRWTTFQLIIAQNGQPLWSGLGWSDAHYFMFLIM